MAWRSGALFLHANTSALRVIDADNKQWLIDCGPFPRALGGGGEVNDIDAITSPTFTRTTARPDGATEPLESCSRQKPVIIYCQPAQQPVLMQLAALANWPQADLGFTIDWQECREAGRGRTGRSALPHPA